ncbi:NADH-quinone oxidoreductase subunit L, partial [Aeromonas aquatica]|uniref:NADH-quinone oxidoreductase subunit L n=1 Tax=Aeromonas aquatica TaxID=558964 RepID=UPI00286F7280
MSLLFLTFLFPLLGWLVLAFSIGRLGERTSALIGVGSIGLSALTTLWVGINFLGNMPEGGVYTQTLWQWMAVGEFTPSFRLALDGLSLTMLGVVTGVGFFIHLFASWYMRGEEGYSRFFTYTNLFIASMVFLVLADDLLFVYLGWEGVGLCSYLLIGFYYRNPANGAAALKAFVVTRVGDVFLAIGLFVLYRELGTLNIHELLVRAPAMFAEGSPALSFACLMLLGGAVGKSAQLPLQTWLADAMAGPTPVSALIHAATMVTAGVYLIARTHGLFLLAPEILHLVALVGAITLVLAGFAALVQTDIKRILAYSTMSQIGYMFLALGVGAWDGAIFHLMTHAFFKALLFLSAGAVIVATHHEQNIFKMGGLRKSLPLVYACFLVGGSALAALPLVTAGFYSKDAILWQVQASGQNTLLWAGLVGAFLTSLYTFRLIFIAFHGKPQTQAHAGHGLAHKLPLLVLLVLSTAIGAWITPPLAGVLPAGPGDHIEEGRHSLEILSGVIAVAGIALAAFLFLGERRLARSIAESAPGRLLSTLWFNAW